MNGEIICVGTELLLGNIVNTNAQYLGQELAELGINLYNQSVVGDNADRLIAALQEAMDRSDVIILTGGLGPTADDITKEIAAKVAGVDLVEDADVLATLEEYYARQGRAMPRGVTKQALLPEGAVVFDNDVGTAPGFCIETEKCKIIAIPGPPKEMKTMFASYVKPYLKSFVNHCIYSQNLHIYGMGESEVANLLGELLEGSNPTAATYAKTGEVLVRVTASANSEAAARALCSRLTKDIAGLLGSALYLVGDGDLSTTTVGTLKEKGLKVATAESCTAGMLSKCLTDVSGSSAVFEMGVSAYANDIKRRVLGVPQEVLDEYGAVSGEVAALMAKGVRSASGANIGIGITGVAGPEPSEGKPVGLVYVGMTDGKSVWIRRLNAAFNNDRDRVRAYATLAAMDMIRRYASAYPLTLGGGATAGDTVKIYSSPAAFSLPEGTAIAGFSAVEAALAEAELLKEEVLENEEAPELVEATNEADEVSDQIAPLTEEPQETAEVKDVPADFGDELQMIGVVYDPDAHIGYEDIHTDSSDYITEDLPDEDSETPKNKEDKPNIFIRILKYFCPWKGDKVAEIIRKIIFIIALAVFIGTGIYLINYFHQGTVNRDKVAAARSIYSAAPKEMGDNGMLLGFQELYKQNDDIKGWIRIPDTVIDYPVYQTNNNDFYVDYDMSREKSRYGAIFIEADATVSNEGNSQNLTLHGHNMLDDSMFGSLMEYLKLEYYKKNPVVEFDTLYGTGEYKVFAVIVTNADKEQDGGKLFNYRQADFSSDDHFLNWIANVKARSVIDTGISVEAGDEVISLSTCADDNRFFKESRLVVFARKIRQGESRHVNVKAAKMAKNPLYPQAYYDKHGGKKPEIDLAYFSSKPKEENNTPPKVEDVIIDIYSGFDAEGNQIEIKPEDVNDSNITTATETVEVEDLKNLSLTTAIKHINAMGLYLEYVDYAGDDINLNTVLEQSIEAGTTVDKGSKISLTVSGYDEDVVVPNLVGKQEDEAIELADNAGITLSIVSCASKEKKGTVIMQSYAEGTVITDRYMVVHISNGRNILPQLKDLSKKEATQILEKAGFTNFKFKNVTTVEKTQDKKILSLQDKAENILTYGSYYNLSDRIIVNIGKYKKPAKEDSSDSSQDSSSKEDNKNEDEDKDKDKDKDTSAKKDEDKEEDKKDDESDEDKDLQDNSNEHGTNIDDIHIPDQNEATEQ